MIYLISYFKNNRHSRVGGNPEKMFVEFLDACPRSGRVQALRRHDEKEKSPKDFSLTMKFCQIKRKNKINKIIILFVFIILFFSLFNNVKIAFAGIEIFKGVECEVSESDVQIEDAVKEKMIAGGKIKEIQVIDMSVVGQLKEINCTDTRNFAKRVMDQITTWSREDVWKALKISGDIAWRQALRFFLNQLAFDMATYLATGDKGQLPMFETEGWGGYLENVADSTAGAFIEELGKNMGVLKFNLCRPNADILLKINLGLDNVHRPRKPSCTFSQLRDNWEAALNDKDFLPKFQDMFNPWSNDLGIALTLQTGMDSEITRAVNEATQARIEGKGWRPVRSLIEGRIKTPADLVGAAARQPIVDSTASEKLYTGSILADSIDIFINTLIGKLIDKWLKDGLVTDFPANIRRWNSLADPEAQRQDEGITGAESRFRSLIEPNFKVRAAYDILAELTICPDPTKAGPTNCVIDEKFREAIEKRLTVSQAIEQGYLSANGVFGFTADGLEPKFNEGYPYRSMLILRKFRIIPVGWEIAAQKIKDCQNNTNPEKCQGQSVDGTKNLSDLVNCAAVWCIGLVDPNWVLKAPQNFCAKEGAGPEILSEQVTGEGAASSLSILRNDTYCADEKSLIKENSDGSNPLYGYCTEERRIWDFNAKSCAPRDNTCQTFQNGDQTVSYLQNTLDFSVCNAGNAGCKKYATSGSYDEESKTVVWDGSDNPIYLNKNAGSCEAADQGCHGFIRIIPEKTETYDDIIAGGIDKANNRFNPAGLIYEKLLPDYLEAVCYDDQGRLKVSAPAQCSNFVRQCKKEEAGCELYTNVIDGSKIPAKVKSNDYCPAECVGYDTFVQKETSFDSSRSAFLIPKTAKICSAESAGCDEFTNLEKISTTTPNLAEQKEYYSYLRQCIKPDTEGKTCGEFYNWEGSDETGYQLKVTNLQADGAGPAVTENDASLCNAEIYNYPLSNPAHNPDCRQFYNRAGEIFYHLYKFTISCSEDCHPYRRTELNVDQNISQADDCSGVDKHWDEETSRCLVCKSGGLWSTDNNACIYLAIPSQGTICPAAQNGCREYNGNTGNDVRNIFTDDFSGGLTGNWTGFNGSEVTPSSEALTLDADNKGNSLSVTGSPFSASRTVGAAVSRHKSYVLSFLAKAAGKTDFNIFLSAGGVSGARAEFAQIKNVGADWQIYKTNLTDLSHEITADEILLIQAGQNFYIDSVSLTEIADRYYLIKDSWRTPLACDSELDGVYHEHYMLGCDQYANRAGEINYLKSFSELCYESAVGCELMIDTKNSASVVAEEFTNDGTTVTIPADEFAYVVYDQNKLCNQEAKGCALLGQSYEYENAIFYGDVYLKNDPDNYKTILCGEDAVSCQAFTYNEGGQEGEKHFKDPGDQVCEWRRQIGAGESQGWFKKKVKRCDDGSNGGTAGNGIIEAAGVPLSPKENKICLTDNDCNSAKCILDGNDYNCPTNETKTLGLGGIGGRVSQPGEDSYGKWAGICAAANSGCGEYIDPVSRFNTNIIFNGSFADLDNDGRKADGWGVDITQDINLEPNTVYRLARVKEEAGELEISECKIKVEDKDVPVSELYEIDQNNNLIGPADLIKVEKSNNVNSKIFYYKGNDKASCIVSVNDDKGAVELKPAVIDYQLAQNLDAKNCNGVVDFNKGCVLFNERSQAGANLAKLKWDADTGEISGEIADQDKDSNIILKVTPDRVCDKWLACRSYVKDEKGNNICYNVGLCDAVDDKGDCISFIASPKTNQTIESLGADKISNLSGYAKAGLAGGSLGGDYYPLGAMEQKGEVANLANGGFEFYGANGYPIGWNWQGGEIAEKSWDTNVFSVINNPIAAQVEGIGYAREGRAFLKLGSSYDATSEDIDVLPGTDYIITAYVNTKNLKSNMSIIDILNNVNEVIASQVIKQSLGNDWQFQVGKFRTGQSNSVIKIKLYSSGLVEAPTEGNFYFDDIKIRPALNSKDNWHTTQSCRLYPQTDSLSCDYYEDSGKRQKGWPGYCLEYDRPPGNPNACVLWYPVDRVKGDGIEEGAGYNGKFPVYYTTSVKKEITNLKALNSFIIYTPENGVVNGLRFQRFDLKVMGIEMDESLIYAFNKENLKSITLTCKGAGTGGQNSWGFNRTLEDANGWHANSSGSGNNVDVYAIFENSEPYNFLYIEANNITDDGGDSSDISCLATFNYERLYAAEIVQTVNAVGQNKFWSSRVYEHSDYTLSCNLNIIGVDRICSYGSDQVPFGSIVPPANSLSSLYNPYEWDSATAPGKQPLYYGPNNGQSRMGQELSVDNIKQIFAKNYGAWQWNQQICQGGVKDGDECVNNNNCQGLCNGDRCVRTIPGPNEVTTQSCEADVVTTCDNLSAGSCVNAGSNKICLGGNKEFLSCANDNDCRGCAGQSLGVCSDNSLKCQGGANNGAGCLSDNSCNNDEGCTGFDVGVCNSGTLKCDGGNKDGASCTLNTCNAVEHTCNGGSKIGKYCDSDDDCNDCKGCPSSSFGTCESADICQGGSRADSFCLNGNNGECNNGCTNFDVGDCVQKKICDSGCHRDKVCIDNANRNDNGLCRSTRCYFCLPSVCSDGRNCAGDNTICSGSCPQAEYKSVDRPDWGPPGTLTNAPLDPDNGLCNRTGDGVRLASAYCAILPQVSNIKVQNKDSGLVELTTSQFINLTFNSKVDSQQLPLVMYAIDWGDNEKTVMTGAEMLDRPAESGNPHSLYHLYSYWDLKTKANSGVGGIDCLTPGECRVKPKIQIKDNWGWCNLGQTINVCGDEQWDSFDGWVVVKEK